MAWPTAQSVHHSFDPLEDCFTLPILLEGLGVSQLIGIRQVPGNDCSPD